MLSLGGLKPRSLLAVLLLRLNHPLSSDELIDALWGETPPATARKSLQTHVWQLRQALESESEPSVLVTRGAAYELRASPDQVDAHRFEALFEEGSRAAGVGDHLRSRDLLDEALGLWRGPPLSDLRYEEFAQSEIFRLEDLRWQALEERVEADLALGRHADVVGELRSALTEEPLRERLWEQLALAFYRSGRAAEALRACREAGEVLDRELGAPPGPRLRTLQERIGREDPALAWRPPDSLVEDSSQEAGPAPVRPFVGRDRELGRLRAIFDQAYEGRGWVAAVSGEPGIGKTRLLRELEPHVRMRGGRMLWSRPHPDVGAPAYWPVSQLLRDHVATLDGRRASRLGPQPSLLNDLAPEVGERLGVSPGGPSPPGPSDAQLRLFEAVARYFMEASSAQPLVLVVDDLQWVDESTLLLLRHLADQIAGARVLLLSAFRDTELQTGDLLEETLAELARSGHFDLLSLGGLSDRAMVEYLGATLGERAPGDIQTIYEATGGNPFFLVEVASLAAHHAGGLGGRDVPPSVRTVIRRRVALLSEGAQQLLPPAAVAGPEFSDRLVASVAGVPDDRALDLLEEAATARILERSGPGGSFSFAHDLIRDALVDELPASERVGLHVQIAKTLEQLAGDHPERAAARLAVHFARSGRPEHLERAIHYEILAGEQASGVSGWQRAAEHYQRALGLLDRVADDPGRRADLLLRLSTCRRLAGDVAGAGTDLFGAFDIHRRAGDGPGMARVVIEGLSDEVFIEADRAVALTEEALEANREAEPELRARLLARRAWEPLGYDDASNRAAREAIELAVRHGLADIEAVMHDRETHRVMHEGRFAEARELARAGHRAAHRVGNAELASHSLAEIMGTHNMDGDLDAALHAAQRVIQYGREHGAVFWVQVARVVGARIHILRAEPEDMERLIEDVPERVFLSPLVATATWAEVMGDLEEADRRAERAVELLPLHRMAGFLRGIYLGLRARIAFRRGNEEAARRAFAGWREAVGESFGQYRAAAVGEIDEALPWLADERLLEEIYQELIAHDGRATFPGRPLDHMRGSLALALGLPDRAEEHFRTGLTWAEGVRSPIEAGRNLAGLARVAEWRGEDGSAHWSRAADLLAPLGADGYLESAVARDPTNI